PGPASVLIGPDILISDPSYSYLTLSFYYLSIYRLYRAEEMEPPATAVKRSSRRLLFDRRYGWVVDEWKDPSEEALAGGRGMFCVVPLGKALFQTASQSINSAVEFLNMKLHKWENPMRNPKSSSGDGESVAET
ncbi:unnamed protein product, partial [Thlaspi arvense]